MRTRIFYSLIPYLLLACGTGGKHGSNDAGEVKVDTPQNISTADLNGCYLMNIGKDTAKLRMEVTGNEVSGTLLYKRFEKDSNSGTFRGKITGEKIRLWYRFASEGQVSVREVCFRIISGKLAEGYGDVELQNDTAIFKYPSTLSYEEKHPYVKTACD